jgi:CheY-like chemotaxis protein
MYRILQVEDLPSDAYLIRREVKKVLDPCEFRVVETKEDFLATLLEFKPDIILSDVCIPGFDWHSALLLTSQHSPHTPFLVVSGTSSEEVSKACIQAGATDYVNKNDIHKLGPVILNALK